jgi:hypothetical protein
VTQSRQSGNAAKADKSLPPSQAPLALGKQRFSGIRRLEQREALRNGAATDH